MFHRRGFLQGLSSLPWLAGIGFSGRASAAVKRDYFRELGVKPFINAAGTYTTLTASLMQPEVVQAIEFASKQFVRLNELHDAVGQRLAQMLSAEAAMVTSGAAAALTVGTAACVAGKNPDFIKRIPEISGMKSEVVMLKSHRYGYDHAVRNCGVKIIEVETSEQMEAAINERSAMMLFFNANEPLGAVKAEEFVRIGKKRNVPTFNDAAADVPPVGNLTKYGKMGFDLVTFSGGKGMRGPQSCGILFGRRDLIEAARMNNSPNGDSIGRGLKVNKEEMLGMMVAVENFMKQDHAAEWKEWEKRVGVIADTVGKINSVSSEQFVPEIANAVPHLRLKWDAAAVKITVAEVVKQLREGDPSIEASPMSKDDLVLAVWMLQPGEAQIVAKRVREILKSGAA